MKRILVVFFAVVAAAGFFVAAARMGWLDADYERAMKVYGGPPSQFVEIDGTRLHYRDEGEGPPIVLLHGSRGNLQQWDGWVAVLSSEFRVVRVDALAHGLTGPDGNDDYSAERSTYLLNRLFGELGLERFVLGGTSAGSTQAVRYAAAFPERVEKLLLSTVPLRLPSASRVDFVDRLVFWSHNEILGTTATSVFWRTFLRSIYGDPSKVTDELVARYRVLNTLPGQQARFRRRLDTWWSTGGPDRDYAAAGGVTAPTLIQWGASGPVLPAALFCEIVDAFTSTSPQVIQYPDLGHLLVIEDASRTVQDALRFVKTGEGGDTCESPGDGGAVGKANEQ